MIESIDSIDIDKNGVIKFEMTANFGKNVKKYNYTF